MRFLVMLLTLGLMMTVPVSAAAPQRFDTGKDLLRACKTAVSNSRAQDTHLDMGLCMGYVDGFLSGYSARGIAGANSAPLCSHMDRLNRLDVAKMVVKYLEEAGEAQLTGPMSTAMLGSVWSKMTCAHH
jgi:hypothetical protein